MPNGTYGGVGEKGAEENLSLAYLPDYMISFFPMSACIWSMLMALLLQENDNIMIYLVDNQRLNDDFD